MPAELDILLQIHFSRQRQRARRTYQPQFASTTSRHHKRKNLAPSLCIRMANSRESRVCTETLHERRREGDSARRRCAYQGAASNAVVAHGSPDHHQHFVPAHHPAHPPARPFNQTGGVHHCCQNARRGRSHRCPCAPSPPGRVTCTRMNPPSTQTVPSYGGPQPFPSCYFKAKLVISHSTIGNQPSNQLPVRLEDRYFNFQRGRTPVRVEECRTGLRILKRCELTTWCVASHMKSAFYQRNSHTISHSMKSWSASSLCVHAKGFVLCTETHKSP